MTVTCKEDSNLNYREINCANVGKIISVTNFLKFDDLRFTKNDFTTVRFWNRDLREVSYHLS